MLLLTDRWPKGREKLLLLLSFYWPATVENSTSKDIQSICLLLVPSSALLSLCASESPGCPIPALLK